MNTRIYKWDEPIRTKSGRDVIEIWNELQEALESYGNYKFTGDKINMVIKAKLIRKLQNDLGLKLDNFPELGIFQ